MLPVLHNFCPLVTHVSHSLLCLFLSFALIVSASKILVHTWIMNDSSNNIHFLLISGNYFWILTKYNINLMCCNKFLLWMKDLSCNSVYSSRINNSIIDTGFSEIEDFIRTVSMSVSFPVHCFSYFSSRI